MQCGIEPVALPFECKVYCTVYYDVKQKLVTICIVFNTFTAPTLELVLVSSTTRLPDVAPYNTFSLTCTATAPEGVVAPKVFTWRRADPADDTCDDFSVVGGNVDSNLEQPVSTSTLNVTVSNADIGTLRYCCQVSITDLDDMDVSDNRVTSITVVGESGCLTVWDGY